MLTAPDLRPDPLVARKIRRLQQAHAAEAEESEDYDDDDGVAPPIRGPIPLHGSSDEDSKAPSTLQIPATQQPPQSSIIEDLGSTLR